MRKSVSGWIPDWFPKVEKEESRKWEPVDGIQEKITDVRLFFFRRLLTDLLCGLTFRHQISMILWKVNLYFLEDDGSGSTTI